jgi:hypothetical protein
MASALRRAAVCASSSSSILTISSICTRNHGSILVSCCTSSSDSRRRGVAHVPDALGAGLAQLLFEQLAVLRLLVHAVDAHFQAAQRLLERFLEGAADGHHLAHLHLRGQAVVGGGNFSNAKRGILVTT